MNVDLWYIGLGVLFAGIAVSGTLIERLPASTALVYFFVGLALGRQWLNLLPLSPTSDTVFLERAAEIAVLVSLFTAGLKLRVRLGDKRWAGAFRLAFPSMWVTVLLSALAGHFLFGLCPGVSVLLGAMLAPTDPVLASEVEVTSPFDENRLRFAITGEAGMNDGSAFPFLLLGLGVLRTGSFGAVFGSWLGLHFIYATVAGIGLGALAGKLFGHYILHLRIVHGHALGYNDFLALGLIGVTFGTVQLCQANGFLAVFAAGYGLRYVEMSQSRDTNEDSIALPLGQRARDEIARSQDRGPVYMTATMLEFNKHYERITEFALVIMIGAMFTFSMVTLQSGFFTALLFLVIRPLGVNLGLLRSGANALERGLVSWFGMRGVGSLYYLLYALNHGLAGPQAKLLVDFVFTAIMVSIVLHGVTATLLKPLVCRAGGSEPC